MPNPFTQQVRQRKVIYFAIIVVLFSVGLIHRKWWIEEEAVRLKLREVAKGEVELTSSAVRLSLTGSRGLAVTFLWSAALEQQERHEWNELELLIGAITKLQPYFITPWLFQGWNLAYNVSVECDRPHDKYYYVSRGIRLLAEGERRNTEQSAAPGEPGIGQPDLRHFIGVAYQGKFGVSDEKVTMRSLLDMSCIDPLRRDPDRFWKPDPQSGRTVVDLDELARFCQNQPRLVRRLREHLGYTDPKQIVAFLSDNREIPSRFEKPTPGPQQTDTPLKADYREQFPALPDPRGGVRMKANTLDFDLGNESFDVYLVARTWFEFAQQPVPPPNPSVTEEIAFDRLKYRLPKAPSLPIYRGFPARAQSFAAEVLQEEGWFDADGWLIRDWFDHQVGLQDVRVGTEPKYHSGPAWDRAYAMYLNLGIATGLYLSPADRAKFEKQAQLYRDTYNIGQLERGPLKLPPEHRSNEAMKKSLEAHLRLVLNAFTARMTNFEGLFHQTEAERTVEQVTARKFFHQAERLRRFENPELALALYDAAWPLWLTTSLRFPKFNEIGTIQEDAYDLQLKHLRLMQKQYPGLYRSLATTGAEFADLSLFKALLLYRLIAAGGDTASIPAHLTIEELLDPSDKSRILPIRKVRGLLDSARVYNVPNRQELGQFLLTWSQAAGTPRWWLPGQELFTLVAFEDRDRKLQPGWQHLYEDTSIQIVKQRYGLVPLPKEEPPPAMMDPSDPASPQPMGR